MRRLMFGIFAPVVVALVVPTVSARASDPAPTAEAAPVATKKVKRKEVCRTVAQTGSRMYHRICKTVDEWVNEQARANGAQLGTQARGSSLEGQDAAASLGGPN